MGQVAFRRSKRFAGKRGIDGSNPSCSTNFMEKEKKAPTSGVRVFESKMFPGEGLFIVYDKTGDLISENGFKSEAAARERIGQIKKVFRNRFCSIRTEK